MLDKMKDMLGMKKATKGTELSHRDLMLKEKEAATKAKKPWVGVLDTQVNKDNIKKVKLMIIGSWISTRHYYSSTGYSISVKITLCLGINIVIIIK